MGVTAANLDQIPMSPDLGATLARGADFAAGAGAPEVTLEHLLAGLCDDPDAIAVLDASQVDIPALKDDVLSRFALAPDADLPPSPDDFGVSQGVRRILEAAAAAARGSRRRDINGAIVLAAIVGDARSMAAEVLQGHGLTFDSAIRALQTALAAPARESVTTQQPVADDVLARARERVQSRSTPSLRDIMNESPRSVPPPPAPPAMSGPSPFDDANERPSHHGTAAETSPSAEQRDDRSQPGNAPPQGSLPPHPNTRQNAPQPARPSAPAHLAEPQSAPLPESFHPASQRAEPSLSFPDTAANRVGDRGANPPNAYPPEPALRPPEGPARGHPINLPRPIPQHGSNPPPIPPPAPLHGAAPGSMRGRGPAFGHPGAPPPGPFPGLQPEGSLEAKNHPGSLSADTGLHADANHEGQFSPGAPASARPLPRASTPANRTPARKRGKRAKIEAGQLAENIPRAMRVGRTERVEIRIANASVPALTDDLDGGGTANQHRIAVTKAMSVRVRAPDGGFFIETASPETRWIENGLDQQGDDFASWRFLITPQLRGWSTLQIVVSARTIGAEGIAAETALPEQVVEVKVRRNLKRSFARIFGWSVAAIIGGALATIGGNGLSGVLAFLNRFVN